MVAGTAKARACTASFSGVDGAGKSTQIELLVQALEKRGLKVRVVRFWDDVAALTGLREKAGHTVFKGEKGVGRPDAPVNRRDKNVRGWPMTGLRFFLYFLDALSLRRVFKLIVSKADFVIFDRYVYDELANLDLGSYPIRVYGRFLRWLVPHPGIGFVLDADPERARARKPEYPIEFIRFNRSAYMRLSEMFGEIAVISPMGIELVHQEVLARCLALLGQSSSERSDPRSDTDPTQPSLLKEA